MNTNPFPVKRPDAVAAPCHERAVRMASEHDIDLQIGSEPDDGYVIRFSNGRSAVEARNPRSALWGVNRFRQADGAEISEQEYRPRFSVRGLNLCESLRRHTDEQVRRLFGRMEQWRMNTVVIHTEYGYRARQSLIDQLCAERGIARIFYVQTSLAFLQDAPSTAFAKDPEGRPWTPVLGNTTKACASDPAVLSMLAERCRDFLRRLAMGPEDRVLFLDSDGSRVCFCERCRGLSALDQWMRQFNLFADTAGELGIIDRVEYIAYLKRFRPPSDLRTLQKISGVMFDTHLRFRWAALGRDHAFSDIQADQAEADPQLARQPMNRYLPDMLQAWRAAVRGRLYVFENLMMQATMSCPQPCTHHLLADLDLLEDIGVDGVLYEAFEPGIDSFADQLARLSEAAWGEAGAVQPSALDLACDQLAEESSPADLFARNMSPLKYLETDRFDGVRLLAEEWNDPVLIEYAVRLKAFIRQRDVPHWKSVVEWIVEHKTRFDWIYIAHLLAKQVPVEQWHTVTDERAREFLDHGTKLWDFMERHESIHEVVDRICRRLMKVPG